jgi:macrolide transport system ATP-binding/permease protein
MILPPQLDLKGLRRDYPSGDGILSVLKDIDLTISPGEMVAIVGQSGSGKSTLMNLLGCLDKPTQGEYRVGGRLTSDMSPDELAQLRREHFGFVFQRYHLLGDLTAQANVEVPAVYAGINSQTRRVRARDLLNKLGMGERCSHKPGQLSGGQQQRVSVARALMNGGEIVLADEPTGALDSASGAELMRILKGLHAKGHTIIIVTHDRALAEHCQRIIELKDGVIIADRKGQALGEAKAANLAPLTRQPQRAFGAALESLREALAMALLAMNAHRLRTFLTMLGIIIGITSVVSVVALGNAARSSVINQIAAIGTNTLEIVAGRGFGDLRASKVNTLTLADGEALSKQTDYVDSVTPNVQTSLTVRYANIAANAQINGVGIDYFRVKNINLASGRFFDQADVSSHAALAIIDDNARTTFFGDKTIDPLGQVIILGSVPVRIIGVTEKKTGIGAGSTLSLYMPHSSVSARLLGSTTLRSLTLRTRDDIDNAVAEANVTKLLIERHGTKDFYIINSDQIRQTINTTTMTLTVLVSVIAVIALVVGGIGVMNIMLVSVTERTREIGVRMAVGARQKDILQQFLIEAILVCLIGGATGVAIAFGFAAAFSAIVPAFPVTLSASSIFWAFLTSTLVGLVFGFLPARNAARLDPVAALARD